MINSTQYQTTLIDLALLYTNHTAESFHNEPRYWLMILFIFPAITLFGNSLVVCSVYREASLRSATNYFIVSLAIADIFLAVLVMPISIILEINNHVWIFSSQMCDAFIMFDVMFCTSSILNLVAISIDRFVAVTKPIQYSRHNNFSRIYITIAITWFISLGIALPIPFGINSTEGRNPYECAFLNSTFILCSSVGSFYLPAIIMVFLYYRIFQVIRERARQKSSSRMTNCHNSSAAFTHHQKEMYLEIDGENECFTCHHEVPDNYHYEPVDTPPYPNCREEDQLAKPIFNAQNSNNRIPSPLINENGLNESSNERRIVNTIGDYQQLAENISSNSSHKKCCVIVEKNDCSTMQTFDTMKEFRKHLKRRIQQAKKERDNVPGIYQCMSMPDIRTVIRATVVKKLSRKHKTDRSNVKRERKATKTLAIVLGVFLICWLPYFCTNILYGLTLKYPVFQKPAINDFIAYSYGIFTWFGYVNSFLNPIIYTTFNIEFRRAFYKLLAC